MFKKFNLCAISFILNISIFIYFFSLYFMDSTFFNQKNIESYKEDVMLQTVSLAVIFVMVTFFYTLYRYYLRNNKRKSDSKNNDIVMENKKLKSSLMVDLLTNLANKKYFDQKLDEEFRRAMREKQPISLLIVNIDEFSAFQDIYGNDDGNESLKMIANILVKHCNRATDFVARIDKDEFGIILSNTREPKTVSQNCVNEVQRMQISHENSIASNVLTISIGTSTIDALDIEHRIVPLARIVSQNSVSRVKIVARS